MAKTDIDQNAPKAEVNEAPLVEGSLWRAIWLMTWPLVLTTVCTSILGLVDVQVAKKLGYAAQGAVGLAEQVIFLFMIFFMCTAIGTTAMVSRAFGEKNHEEAVRTTSQSLAIAIIAGLVLTVVALFASEKILRIFSPSAEFGALSSRYLEFYSFFLIPFGIVCVINAAFRAAGDAKTPLLITLTSTIISIALDFATVYGNWPVPNLGLRGIALAGVTGYSVAALVSFERLSRSNLKDSLKLLLPLNIPLMIRILRVSLPTGFQRLGWVLSTFFLFFILNKCPQPTAALASWVISLRVEALLFMPMVAFSLAVSSIVGQNLGAKQYERAFKAGWNVANLGVAFMLAMGLVLFFGADLIATKMTDDPTTIGYVSSYLRVNAFAEPMLALGMVLSGALQGAGDTATPMWITLTTQWVYRLPAAYIMAVMMHLGPIGVWYAMSSSMYLIGIFTAMRYQSRKWMATQV
jgi:putative MATE family efflux protein